MKKKKLRKLLAEAEMVAANLDLDLYNAKVEYEFSIEKMRTASANKDKALWKSNEELAAARRTIESHKGVKFDATDVVTR